MSEKFVTRMAVFVIMRNDAGEILLQRRSNTGFMDGCYDFAASGHVEHGESIRAAAIRELEEEIGVIADESDLRLVHINQNFLDMPYMNFTFTLDTWQGEPSICEPEKCSDLAYFSADNLPEECALNVCINRTFNFEDTLTYSVVTAGNYEDYTDVPYPRNLS